MRSAGERRPNRKTSRRSADFDSRAERAFRTIAACVVEAVPAGAR